jgi:DNA-binding MarR family transcriptional regulator
VTKKFTPTEELALEALMARHRLGHTLWTFDSSVSKALLRLADKGYVTVMHGVTENTVRARLTSLGEAEFLSENYKAPAFKDAKLQILTQIEELAAKDGFITAKQIVKFREAVLNS